MAPKDWRVAGVSLAGFSHLENGSACQDAHRLNSIPNGWFVAVASDGAGSAARAAEGAAIVCKEVADYLVVRIDEQRQRGLSPLDPIVARQLVESAVKKALDNLNGLVAGSGGSLAQFHATLIGAVAGPDGGFFFHVGDGAACAMCSDDLSQYIISPPENGEYANETFFVTQDIWQDHLRLTLFGDNFNLIVLMTDGVTPYALARQSSGPAIPFFDPIVEFLLTHPPKEDEAALTSLLQRDAIRRITADDKTFVWGFKVKTRD